MTELNRITIQARRIFALAILATVTPCELHAQVSKVEKFQIRVTAPAYTGLPIWIYAQLGFPLEIRYPYGEDPGNFGPNKLEVKYGGRVIEQG
jgi:hypothetical protein